MSDNTVFGCHWFNIYFQDLFVSTIQKSGNNGEIVGCTVVNELCCVQCQEPASKLENLAKPKAGVDRIMAYSRFIGDEQMANMLLERIMNSIDIWIHHICQKDKTDEMKRIEVKVIATQQRSH